MPKPCFYNVSNHSSHPSCIQRCKAKQLKSQLTGPRFKQNEVAWKSNSATSSEWEIRVELEPACKRVSLHCYSKRMHSTPYSVLIGLCTSRPERENYQVRSTLIHRSGMMHDDHASCIQFHICVLISGLFYPTAVMLTSVTRSPWNR
jgi:hypothetical protein